MKECYQYHHITGDYMGQEFADEDPETPGEYLLPSNCTFVRPTCISPQWDGTKWVNNIGHLVKLERSHRNVLLRDSDWCLSADSPLTEAQKEEARSYRTALRNIPQQINFPVDIVWPKKPTFVTAN